MLVIHHLHVAQSERLVWLCEELGLAYDLQTYARAPLLAPAEYKALHRAGTAPVVQDGDLTLAESGACVEYISHRHGGGRLFPGPDDGPAYADFLYWWHWSNATFQPALGRGMMARSLGIDDKHPAMALTHDRLFRGLAALDERLRDNQWLAGDDFTAADIMVVFPLTSMRYFYGYSLREYPNVLGYLARIGRRDAYRRAMAKADPDMELALGPDPPKPFAAMG